MNILPNDVILHDGWLKVVERNTNGRIREIVVQEPAVAVAIVTPDFNKILLVKQPRDAVQKEVWEIIAGMMDIPGEDQRKCIVRECAEESSGAIQIDEYVLKDIANYYPNIGNCDHNITIYYTFHGEVEIPKSTDADVVEAKWFTFEEIEKMIRSGEICDGKTNIAFSKLENIKLKRAIRKILG